MDTLAPMLGALGMLGIVAAVLLGTVVLLILPLWAILHCLASDRPAGWKAFVVGSLILTWGPGAVLYGLFASGSRAFRVFTLVAVLLPSAILVPSVAGLFGGAAIHARAENRRAALEQRRVVEAFVPDVLAPMEVRPFVALRPDPAGGGRAVTLARFDATGVDPADARAVDPRILRVAQTPDGTRTFAITAHDFGTIVPSTGSFTAVEVDPALDGFGWPSGIAYDRERGRVVVLTSHVHTRLYTFDSATADWSRLPAEYRDLPLVGLTHLAADDCLYALEHPGNGPAFRRLHRFNHDGASLGTVTLDPAIPHRGDLAKVQLASSGDRIVVLLPAGDRADGPAGVEGMFLVGPTDGRVGVPGARAAALAE